MKAGQGVPQALHWRCVRFADLGVDNLYDLLALRGQVFIVEQGPYLDPDGIDRQAAHLFGRDAQGVLRAGLRIVDPGIKYAEPSIGRVAVDASLRGTGVGHALVTEGLRRSDALWPGQGLRISAQAHLERFYAAHGFTAVGEVYLEDGIPHREMVRPAQ